MKGIIFFLVVLFTFCNIKANEPRESNYTNKLYLNDYYLVDSLQKDSVEDAYNKQVRCGRTLQFTSIGTLVAGSGFVFVTFFKSLLDEHPFDIETWVDNAIYTQIGLSLMLVSVPIFIWGRTKENKARKSYNAYINETSFWDNKELELGIQGVGLGVKLRF